MSLQDTDFAGTWRLTRKIDDRKSGQTGQFDGQAVLSPSDGGLLYHETGQMRFGGGVMQAERRYLWRFMPDHVDVRFADGAAFHRFTPAGAAPGTDHPCGDDFYQVMYDFTAWPQWQAVWTVQGPRKDYTSYSTYQRR